MLSRIFAPHKEAAGFLFISDAPPPAREKRPAVIWARFFGGAGVRLDSTIAIATPSARSIEGVIFRDRGKLALLLDLCKTCIRAANPNRSS